MTSPAGAISESDHHLYGAGRLYGVEGFDLSTLKTAADTTAALRGGMLYPSVTNVIGVLPKNHLQGWYGREAVKSLHSTIDIVEQQRVEALRDLAAAGVDADVLVAAVARDIPPSLIPAARSVADLEKARMLGARWLRMASQALGGKNSPEHLANVMAGGKVNAEKSQRALYARYMDGDITQVDLEQMQAEAGERVLEVLRQHADGWWVYSMLAGDSKGVALLGNAAARSRDVSAEYGNEVHDLLEHLSMTDNPLAPYAGEHGYHVRAWQTWWKANTPTDVRPELTVRGYTSDGLPYAGTADLFCVIDGEGAVVDYKTSRALDEKSVGLQMSALAYADECPFAISTAIGLHVPRREDAEKLLRFARPDQTDYSTYKHGYRAYEVEPTALAEYWRTFSAARLLWQEMYAG